MHCRLIYQLSCLRHRSGFPWCNLATIGSKYVMKTYTYFVVCASRQDSSNGQFHCKCLDGWGGADCSQWLLSPNACLYCGAQGVCYRNAKGQPGCYCDNPTVDCCELISIFCLSVPAIGLCLNMSNLKIFCLSSSLRYILFFSPRAFHRLCWWWKLRSKSYYLPSTQ